MKQKLLPIPIFYITFEIYIITYEAVYRNKSEALNHGAAWDIKNTNIKNLTNLD